MHSTFDCYLTLRVKILPCGGHGVTVTSTYMEQYIYMTTRDMLCSQLILDGFSCSDMNSIGSSM